MQATDAGAAITRLTELVNAGPGADPDALKEATAILFRLGTGASGYLAEKIAAAREGFETWLSERKWQQYGSDQKVFRGMLLMDIEKLRKALARGSEGQD